MRQKKRFEAELHALNADRDFTTLFDLAVELTLSSYAGMMPLEAMQRVAQEHALPGLVERAQQAAPALAAVLGEKYLGDFLAAWVAASVTARGDSKEAGRRVFDEMAPRHLRRLFDNPIAILDDAGELLNAPPEATERHFQEVRDYRRSLRPEGKRGRPPKTAAPSGRPKRKPLDAELARLTLQAWRNGESVVDLARRLAPEKSRSAGRSYVQRLIERGELDEQKSP